MKPRRNVRRIAGVCLLAALGVTRWTAPLHAQDVKAVVRVTSANLRSTPSLQGAIVGKVVRGDTVQLLVERDDGWSRVRARRSYAWMRTASLTRQPQSLPVPLATSSKLPPRDPVPTPAETTAVVSVATSPATTAGDVDPRLAGRRQAAGRKSSSIPASRDPSRFGVMAGIAAGPFISYYLNGPVIRGFARLPVSGAPFALRADVEVSRMTARHLDLGLVNSYSITDARALLGAEYDVPATSAVEVSVVGSAGLSRQAERVGIDEAFLAEMAALGRPMDLSDTIRWSLAHDIGIGAKIGRLLVVEFHFFSIDGAPFRLLAGVRL